jgi:ribosomal protein L25 (general stress protein Ctc)
MKRIPKVTIEESTKSGVYELHVSDDPEDCFTLAVDNVPITVTLTQVPFQSLLIQSQ